MELPEEFFFLENRTDITKATLQNRLTWQQRFKWIREGEMVEEEDVCGCTGSAVQIMYREETEKGRLSSNIESPQKEQKGRQRLGQ